MKISRIYQYNPIPTLITLLLIFTFTSSLAQKTGLNDNQSFNYIAIEDGKINSTHAIQYSLEIPPGFTPMEPYNYQPTFNNHPFNVSFSAVSRDKQLIIVHAEKVTDGSGFLDYSYLKPVKLSGLNFFMKENCLELTEDIFKQAVDINYVKENGFDFGPAIYLKQFFANSPDGNYEYVLSYGERVCDCSDKTISEEFLANLNKTIDQILLLEEM